VVSRAHPSEIGLSGVAGALATHDPDEAGGVGVRLGPADATPRSVRAMTVPGGVDVVGIEAWDRLGDEEELTFDVDDAVLSVDGERHMELQDAHVAVRPVPEGPESSDLMRRSTRSKVGAVSTWASDRVVTRCVPTLRTRQHFSPAPARRSRCAHPRHDAVERLVVRVGVEAHGHVDRFQWPSPGDP